MDNKWLVRICLGIIVIVVIGLPMAISISNHQSKRDEENAQKVAEEQGSDAFTAGEPLSSKPLVHGENWEQGWRRAEDSKRIEELEQRNKKQAERSAPPSAYRSKPDVPRIDGNYNRDVAAIKNAVLADTISPKSAFFCKRFDLIRNTRGNRVYVGWYSSTDLFGERGRDNIVAEVNSNGVVVRLSIGEI